MNTVILLDYRVGEGYRDREVPKPKKEIKQKKEIKPKKKIILEWKLEKDEEAQHTSSSRDQ